MELQGRTAIAPAHGPVVMILKIPIKTGGSYVR